MTDETHDVSSSQVIHLGVARIPSFTGNHGCLELHALARTFLQDASTLLQVNDMSASHGQYFLLIHAIELALKCYLHEKGTLLETLADGRQYGHNLEKLIVSAIDRGLSISNPHTIEIVRRLNQYTARARIRYDISFVLPLVSDVEAVAKALLDDTRPGFPGV